MAPHYFCLHRTHQVLVRYQISTHDDGFEPNTPTLDLYDAKGKPRTKLCMAGDWPSLYLLDKNGMVSVQLIVTENWSGLKLYDENGKLHSMLGKTQIGTKDGRTIEASLLLFSPDGKILWQAP